MDFDASATTSFVTVSPDDLYPGFDLARPPQPDDFLTGLKIMSPEYEIADAAYLAEYDRWNVARRYVIMHESSQTVPTRYARAYAMAAPAHAWVTAIVAGATPTNLVLYGPVGTGKTYSAVAAARLLLTLKEYSSPVPGIQYHLASQLLKRLKDFNRPEQREELEWATTKAKVLIIDDLGRLGLTTYDQESVAEILDARMEHRPTIVTTNAIGRDELATRYGEYLASRILGGADVHPVEGPDRRQGSGLA